MEAQLWANHIEVENSVADPVVVVATTYHKDK